MSAEQVARRHYAARRSLVDALAAVALRLWRAVDPARIAESWTAQLPALVTLTSATQVGVAQAADSYLNAALTAQGVDVARRGRVVPSALAGVASDGRPLGSLLYQPAIAALTALGEGLAVDDALDRGYDGLDTIVRTQVADAGRAADQVALVVRPAVTGYVRMVVGESCARCLILAGQRYEWNRGFLRHPQCDCIHVPAAEDSADDIRTDPKAAFKAMPAAEQDRVFGKAGAEAIREGADIGQVVNARRSVYTAADGRRLTREGATRRGFAGKRLGAPGGGRAVRLMPEQIFREADGDREEAVSLLREHGYII